MLTLFIKILSLYVYVDNIIIVKLFGHNNHVVIIGYYDSPFSDVLKILSFEYNVVSNELCQDKNKEEQNYVTIHKVTITLCCTLKNVTSMYLQIFLV